MGLVDIFWRLSGSKVSLENELKRSHESIQKLKEKIKSLQREKAEDQRKNNNLIQQAQEDATRKTNIISELNNQKRRLEQEKNTLDAQNNDLKKRIHTIQSLLANANNRNRELTQQITTEKNKLIEAENETVRKSNQIKELTNEIRRLKETSQITILTNEIRRLEQEKNTLNLLKIDAEKQLNILQNNINNLENQNDEYKIEIKNLTEDLSGVKQRLQETETLLHNYSNEKQALTIEIDRLKSYIGQSGVGTISELTNEIRRLEQEKNALNLLKIDAEQRLNKQQNNINNLENLNEKQKEEIQQLTEKLYNIKQKLQEKEALLQQYSNEKQNLTTENNRLKTEAEQSGSTISKLTREIRRLEQEKNSLNLLKIDAENKLNQLQNENNKTEIQNKKQKKEIQQLTEKLYNIKQKLQEKETLLQQYSNEAQPPSGDKYEEIEIERDKLCQQLESANSERDKLGKALAEKEQSAISRGNQIERLEKELQKEKEEKYTLQKKIAELEKQIDSNIEEQPKPNEPSIKEDTEQKSESNKNTSTGPSATQNPPGSNSGTSRGQGGASPKEGPIDDDDLPYIENYTGYVKRSILQVIDIEHDEEKIIDADEFFSRSAEEIEKTARMLAEAAENGREVYLCACCKTPVKISKRDFGSKEVLFFSHCTHDVSCDWKQEHGHSRRIAEELELGNGETYDYKAKYREIKCLIEESLKTDKSQEIGISNVKANKRIKSQNKFISQRIACVYAKYNDKDIVFELQTNNVLMNTIVRKDNFYRLNAHNVIWIFGADEGSGYDYINKHTYKNTMFANKRNVFIMDKEAMDACRSRQELVLKCNYLDPDDNWHFRKETTGNNGILITIKDLHFDKDTCKPYYYDANEEYFNLHPDIEKEYLDSVVPKEILLKKNEDDWKSKIDEIRSKQSTIIVAPPAEPTVEDPQNTPAPLKKRPTGYTNRWIYQVNGKEGIVDENDNTIIKPEYDEIRVWTNGKYRVRELDHWGVLDEKQNIIVDIEYKKIDKLSEGKAHVEKWTEEYYIDESGTRIPDDKIPLPNGWVKFRQGHQWGIVDSNDNIIADCIYDEVGSFRRRLIGFKQGSFQKLSARYEYRMPFTCKCSRNVNRRACYNVNGVELLAARIEIDLVGKLYRNMCISNISYKKGTVYVSKLSPKMEKLPIDHVDQNSDFALGEIVKVKITRVEKKKIFAKTDDGRNTYFTKAIILRHRDNLNVGETITIKKTGFDHDLDRTIWEYVQ